MLSDVELENIRVWLADIERRYTLKDSEHHCRALLEHIAAITPSPSQGKVERARFEVEAKRQMEAQEMMEDYEAREKGLVWLEGYFDVEALVSQALTEPAQGTMTAPYTLIEECAEILRWRETGLLQQGGYLHARAEKLTQVPEHIRVRVAEDDVCVEAMRFVSSALPLPVSEDGSAMRDAVIEECVQYLLSHGAHNISNIAIGMRVLKSTKHEGDGE